MFVLNNKQTYELGQLYERTYSNEIRENFLRPFQGFYAVQVSENLYAIDFYGVPSFYAIKMGRLISLIRKYEQEGIAVNGKYYTDVYELATALNPAD